MKTYSLIIISILLFAFSCERKTDSSSGASKETKKETVKKEIDLLSDSVNTAWNKLITSDDQKLGDIKRLLDEISYTSDYDVSLHDSLLKQLNVLKSNRFNETLDLDQMDRYDEMTDNYIRKLYELKGKSKEITSHPLAEELVIDINNANSVETIVELRKHYDNWAKLYNNYLKKHKNQLEKLGEPYASLKEKGEIIK